MAEVPQRIYIKRILIDGLYGQYSYDLKPTASEEALSRLFILYGENGTGKTTVLRLLNHLLSREVGAGHRTFLARTLFKSVSVYLSNGMALSATRPEPAIGNFTIRMEKGAVSRSFDFLVDERGVIAGSALGAKHEKFRTGLPDLQITVLADDRKLSSAKERRKIAVSSSASLFGALSGRQQSLNTDDPADQDPSALQPALIQLREWARSRALEGSNAGQRDVNATYAEILKRLAKADESQDRLSDIVDMLKAQGKRSEIFSKFGLTSEIDVDSIVRAISNPPSKREQILAQVIKPYLDSNDARFSALASLQFTLSTFVDELNEFFKNKKITFDLKRGIQIDSGNQELQPEALSSGEKQLLVLFCNVARASNRQSIFIIDEPELSLNVSWQRRLIDALQKLADDNVQFIFATHSLELLARHRNNVAKMVPTKISPALSPTEHEEESEG